MGERGAGGARAHLRDSSLTAMRASSVRANACTRIAAFSSFFFASSSSVSPRGVNAAKTCPNHRAEKIGISLSASSPPSFVIASCPASASPNFSGGTTGAAAPSDDAAAGASPAAGGVQPGGGSQPYSFAASYSPSSR